MSVIEENGQKLAAVLCVASCFPVVATVYAMETDPGWHGDKYINEDATTVKGWQEIENKAYYFAEDGQVDKETTENAVVATVKVDITEEVQEAVKETTIEEEYVEPEVEEYVEPVEDYVEPVVEETYVEPVEDYVEPVVEETYVEPVEDYVEPVVEETYVEPVEDYVEPVVEEYVEPVVEETYVENSNPYADLNARIAASAQTLVGVTDGQWCTEVVQQALAYAGVYDAYQLWPDQYAGQYGYYTSDPQPGNLIYYYNGGRGVDHIAIYIGNGLAVHGNYNGRTVIETVYVPGGAPQFIQVCR